MKTWLLLILVVLGSIVRAQSNYFNKTYVMPNINLAGSVIEVNNDYFVTGQQITPYNRKLILYKLNSIGDTLKTIYYEIDTLSFFSQQISYQDSSIFVYGSFQQTNENLSNNSNLFLARFDLELNLIWMKSYGTNFYNAGIDFKSTKDKGFIVAGSCTNSLQGSEQALLLKIDSVGNQQWLKQYGLPGKEDVAEFVSLSFDNGYLLAGYTRNDFNNQIDAYYLKVDSIGNIVWEKRLDTSYGSFSKCINQLSDSIVLITGSEKTNNVNFDFSGIYLQINAFTGETLLKKKYPYSAYINFLSNHIILKDKSIVFTADQRYLVGNTEINKVLLIKLDKVGNEIWKREYFTDTTRSQYIYNIQKTKDGGYVMCGSAFDTSHIQRAWVIKTDCFGYDSVTYYYKDSICNVEDCYRYQEDAAFIISSDTIDLNISAELDVKNTSVTNAQLSWSFGDGTQINNQASYTHVYQNPGTYEVNLLFEKGICSLSTKKTIVVMKPTVFNNFALYPNPNDGSFTLVNYTGAATKLRLYDALGKLVFSSNITQTQTTFDLNLEIGVYFVTLGDELLQKIVISR